MSKPYTGGCSCRALRYEVSGEPVAMVDCQCRQCQRESGTGHTSTLTFHAAKVRFEGKASTWDTVGDGGTRKRSGFCPTCGAPVYLAFPDMPELFAICAASLDEPERYRPQMAIWTAAAQPWDHVDPSLQTFEKMPPR